MPTKLQKSDAEWRAELTPEQYHILREKGTERPFTGALVNNHADGFYHCAACDAPLFKSGTKFESGSGWPSFFEPISPDAVELHEDTHPRHDPRRSHLRHLRRPPRPRLPRRPQPHRPTLLHQLRLPQIRRQVIAAFSVLSLFRSNCDSHYRNKHKKPRRHPPPGLHHLFRSKLRTENGQLRTALSP